MKNVLIVYATREGQTEKVARRIRDVLSAEGASVTLHNAKDDISEKLEDFDLVVLGASLHAGGLEKELKDFVEKKRDYLSTIQPVFFLVLLSAATKDPKLREEWLDQARSTANEQLALPLAQFEMVAGALMYSKYSLPVRWVMKGIAKKAGEDTDTSHDYEYTDWEQVERFARGLLE